MQLLAGTAWLVTSSGAICLPGEVAARTPAMLQVGGGRGGGTAWAPARAAPEPAGRCACKGAA
jgi:hypothetical protein